MPLSINHSMLAGSDMAHEEKGAEQFTIILSDHLGIELGSSMMVRDETISLISCRDPCVQLYLFGCWERAIWSQGIPLGIPLPFEFGS